MEGGCRIKLRVFEVTSWLWLWLIITTVVAQAQNTNTDPAEVRAINEIFRQWRIPETVVRQRGWNLSGEPCSGAALEATSFDLPTYNPGIICDFYAMDVAGPIPEELWTLVYLMTLNLAQNYLTGPLPPSIGNLTRMQWLSFSGNNFNGSLPSEIGNLRNLQQVYIDSSGVVGEIPSTFANLQNMVTVWASDNEFTGRIPNFIGNWTQLVELRFEGNSFEGSIPPSFSNLTSLQDLRISGLLNGTLDFIRNMKSLGVLVLRNNRISGSIPTDIGGHPNLTRLDLSFNNLDGQIPRGLFNLSQPSFLFLGNNSLNGTLPDAKSASLTNIDVSYNELSGTLPSWVNEANLQLNLVVNNFTLGDSRNSPSGVECLQRNFPCARGSPRYSDFGINCSGPSITSSNQILHEEENEALGAATYYVSSERRWGVSNVGQRDNPRYTISSLRQFTGTLDPELFQTARVSAGSLRYYGLGLENGNYTVTLQFAELEIEDGPSWKSGGRRVFDIYLQEDPTVAGFEAFQDKKSEDTDTAKKQSANYKKCPPPIWEGYSPRKPNEEQVKKAVNIKLKSEITDDLPDNIDVTFTSFDTDHESELTKKVVDQVLDKDEESESKSESESSSSSSVDSPKSSVKKGQVLKKKKKRAHFGNNRIESSLQKNKSLRRLCLEPKRKQEPVTDVKKLVTSLRTVQWLTT
ncbi:putative non-specific serine/threonine protein kinase [Helianthus annuus]|nr:putative non-specific serine/threonine protein kinase [Helianthus annuus]